MLATDRPRFKQELVAEPIEDGGARFIDLMDPDSGNVYRFYEVEYALACAMDGERDVAGIVRWAQEELGLTPSPNEVQTVIATLGDLGYLDVRPAAETVAPAQAIETAPTKPAKPAVDEDLAQGIVVGKQQPAAAIPSENYELGASGGHAPVARAELPPAPDLALGKAGTSTAVKRPEPIAVDDIKLGASGAAADTAAVPVKADLSTDLSSDFSLRPDDVKEAVRASKVMSAVEVPQDILDAVETKPEPKPEPKVEAKKPEPKKPEPKAEAKKQEPAKAEATKPEPPKVEAKKPDAKKSDAKKKNTNDVPTEKLPDPKDVAAAADKVEAKAKPGDKPKVAEPKKLETKKPVVDAKKPVVEEKKPVVAPTAPKSGVSPALIVLLILAVLGGGVFLVWKYVLDKPATDTTEAPPPPPVKKEPPPAPPAPTAKLALDTPAPVDVKAGLAGTIEAIEANDKVVKTGDTVAKFVGNAPIQAAFDALKKDADKATAAVAAAQKELDAAKDDAAKTAAQTKLDAAKKAQDGKQQAVVAKQADLDKFLIKSTADGKLTVVAKKDAKVVDTDVVAKVAQEPMLAATFTAPGGKYVTGSPATLAIKGGDKKLSCTVADVQGDQVKVVCTADASIPAGADVALE